MEHYAVLKNSMMCIYTCIFGTLCCFREFIDVYLYMYMYIYTLFIEHYLGSSSMCVVDQRQDRGSPPLLDSLPTS